MKKQKNNSFIILKTIFLTVILPVLLNLATDFISDFISVNFVENKTEEKVIKFIIIATTFILVICGIVYFKSNISTIKFKISEINRVLGFIKYNDESLFYMKEEEINQYKWSLSNSKKIIYNFERIFHRFPVIYYNMSAKNFLNWIDYLYLIALKELHDNLNARIIVSLHVGEELLNEGIYNNEVSDKYITLKKDAENIIKKILPYALIVDEYEYYARTKGKPSDNPEYFFGTIISQINSYVKKLQIPK